MTHQPPPATPHTPAVERRAMVRIDAAPSGKRFQGVWLEFADGKRWVVDYRPRTPWTWFRDAEVLVTGACYEPIGQAIMATHFRVDRMRFATPPARGTVAYLELGEERTLRGAFERSVYPPGSKNAGEAETMFAAEGDARFHVVGFEGKWIDEPRQARVKAREVTPDYAHAAQTSGRKLWIMDIRTFDSEDDPQYAPRVVGCP